MIYTPGFPGSFFNSSGISNICLPFLFLIHIVIIVSEKRSVSKVLQKAFHYNRNHIFSMQAKKSTQIRKMEQIKSAPFCILTISYTSFIAIRSSPDAFFSSGSVPSTSCNICINSLPVMVSFSIRNAAILSNVSLCACNNVFACS